MIYALKPQFREFGKAFLIVNGVQKFFKFSIVENKDSTFGMPVKNIMVAQETQTIQTTWDLPFKQNMQVVINGEIYKIIRCKREVDKINEQSMGLVKDTCSAIWLLNLVR